MPALHRTRYRSLDLWRGVACLTVVAYHASGVVQRGASPDWSEPVYSALGLGYLGVPLFFVISGYCIAASSDAHRQSGAGGGSFLWRRLRRIYPPYWISVGCTVMLFWTFDALGWGLFHKGPAAQPTVASLSWVQWLGNLTLSETWLHQLIGGEERRFNGAIWSLCFEEQFYLLCFLALTTMPRRFVQVILLLTCAVTLVWASAELLGARERFKGTFFDFGWWQFACGMGVYYRLHYVGDPRLGRIIDRVTLVIGVPAVMILLLLGGSCYDPRSYFCNPVLGLGVATGFAILLVRLHPLDVSWSQSRLLKPLMFTGTISYSLYLIHMPVCKLGYYLLHHVGFWSRGRALLVSIPLCMAASVAVAWIFYRLVEQRFMNKPRARSVLRDRISGHEWASGAPAAIPERAGQLSGGFASG